MTSRTSSRLAPFGTSVFSEMTRLAQAHGAINLAQGFPDFEGPPALIEAMVEAARAGHNQYARSMGAVPLVEAIARERAERTGLAYDPLSEVIVFSGATEGIAAAILGLVSPGDEVVLFEPVYDSYPACVALAGGVPRYVTLRFPDFRLDPAALDAAFSPRTRLVVLNTPHNPTGKVFGRAELELIAERCRRHDAVVLADEVYEHLTYDGAEHVPIASLPGMKERTLSLSSTGKSFNFTGWKVGWGTGAQPLVAAAQAAHQFLTFATHTPTQHAVAHGLSTLGPAHHAAVRAEYQARRDLLLEVLGRLGLRVAAPAGAYFVLADFSPIFEGDDVAFARWLTEHRGVAAIPPSSFYPAEPAEGRRLVRFAFCKRLETLRAAAERLGA
jgi:N-succinyldiaminopimelate aminotransferase